MRLIDADYFKKQTAAAALKSNAEQKGLALIKLIDNQPTAYDVEKVVEQLSNRSALARPVGWTKSYEIILLDDAIEIVKQEVVE